MYMYACLRLHVCACNLKTQDVQCTYCTCVCKLILSVHSMILSLSLSLSLCVSLSLPNLLHVGAERVLLVSSTQTVVEVKQLSKSTTGTTAVPSICNMEIKV